MSFKIAARLALISSLIVISAPAMAGTQADIQTCRETISAQGKLDISAHRLKFLSKKGNRTRTLKLKAVAKNGGESFILTCQLNRKDIVLAINDTPLTQLASNGK